MKKRRAWEATPEALNPKTNDRNLDPHDRVHVGFLRYVAHRTRERLKKVAIGGISAVDPEWTEQTFHHGHNRPKDEATL